MEKKDGVQTEFLDQHSKMVFQWRSFFWVIGIAILLEVNLCAGGARLSQASAHTLAKRTGAAHFEEHYELASSEESHEHSLRKRASDEDLDYEVYQGVVGRPGIDFPILPRIPQTTFTCRTFGNGYFADLEADCQVFHICDDGRKISFLCPNGTIFQQKELICDWWFKVNCAGSPGHYTESAEMLARTQNRQYRPYNNKRVENEFHSDSSRSRPHSSGTKNQYSTKGQKKYEQNDRLNQARKQNRRFDSDEDPSVETVDFEDITEGTRTYYGKNDKIKSSINTNDAEVQIVAETASFVGNDKIRNGYNYERTNQGKYDQSGKGKYDHSREAGRDSSSNSRPKNDRGRQRYNGESSTKASRNRYDESYEQVHIGGRIHTQDRDSSLESNTRKGNKPNLIHRSKIPTTQSPKGSHTTVRRVDTTRTTPYYTPTVPTIVNRLTPTTKTPSSGSFYGSYTELPTSADFENVVPPTSSSKETSSISHVGLGVSHATGSTTDRTDQKPIGGISTDKYSTLDKVTLSAVVPGSKTDSTSPAIQKSITTTSLGSGDVGELDNKRPASKVEISSGSFSTFPETQRFGSQKDSPTTVDIGSNKLVVDSRDGTSSGTYSTVEPAGVSPSGAQGKGRETPGVRPGTYPTLDYGTQGKGKDSLPITTVSPGIYPTSDSGTQGKGRENVPITGVTPDIHSFFDSGSKGKGPEFVSKTSVSPGTYSPLDSAVQGKGRESITITTTSPGTYTRFGSGTQGKGRENIPITGVTSEIPSSFDSGSKGKEREFVSKTSVSPGTYSPLDSGAQGKGRESISITTVSPSTYTRFGSGTQGKGRESVSITGGSPGTYPTSDYSTQEKGREIAPIPAVSPGTHPAVDSGTQDKGGEGGPINGVTPGTHSSLNIVSLGKGPEFVSKTTIRPGAFVQLVSGTQGRGRESAPITTVSPGTYSTLGSGTQEKGKESVPITGISPGKYPASDYGTQGKGRESVSITTVSPGTYPTLDYGTEGKIRESVPISGVSPGIHLSLDSESQGKGPEFVSKTSVSPGTYSPLDSAVQGKGRESIIITTTSPDTYSRFGSGTQGKDRESVPITGVTPSIHSSLDFGSQGKGTEFVSKTTVRPGAYSPLNSRAQGEGRESISITTVSPSTYTRFGSGTQGKGRESVSITGGSPGTYPTSDYSTQEKGRGNVPITGVTPGIQSSLDSQSQGKRPEFVSQTNVLVENEPEKETSSDSKFDGTSFTTGGISTKKPVLSSSYNQVNVGTSAPKHPSGISVTLIPNNAPFETIGISSSGQPQSHANLIHGSQDTSSKDKNEISAETEKSLFEIAYGSSTAKPPIGNGPKSLQELAYGSSPTAQPNRDDQSLFNLAYGKKDDTFKATACCSTESSIELTEYQSSISNDISSNNGEFGIQSDATTKSPSVSGIYKTPTHPNSLTGPTGGPYSSSSSGPKYLPTVSTITTYRPSSNKEDKSSKKGISSTTKPVTVSAVTDHVQGMIKTLKELNNEISVNNRDGLEIPPSSGPETLHSLAEYFGTSTVSDEENSVTTEEIDTSTVDKSDISTGHLSNKTVQSYETLFGLGTTDKSIEPAIATDLRINIGTESNDLEAQHSGNLLDGAAGKPETRKIAQIFADGLSAYLGDPDSFRRTLAEVRPTDPTIIKDSTINSEFNRGTAASYLPTVATTPSPSPTTDKPEILDFSDATGTGGDIPKESLKKDDKTTKKPESKFNLNFIDRVPASKIIASGGVGSKNNLHGSSEATTESNLFAAEINKGLGLSTVEPYLSLAESIAARKPSLDFSFSSNGSPNVPFNTLAVDLLPPSSINGKPNELPNLNILPPSYNDEDEEALQRAQTQSFVSANNKINGGSGKSKINVKITGTTAPPGSKQIMPGHYITRLMSDVPSSTPSPWSNVETFLDPLTINDGLMHHQKPTTSSSYTYLPKPTSTSTESSPVHIDVAGMIYPRFEINNNVQSSTDGTLLYPELTDIPEHILPQSNGMQRIANKIFGNLNETSADHLMNVMQKAEANPTARKLILLLIQTCDEDYSQTVEKSREALLNALIGMDDRSNVEDEIEVIKIKPNRRGKSIGNSEFNRNIVKPTTIATPVTTYHRIIDGPLTTTDPSQSTTAISSNEETTRFEIRVEDPEEISTTPATSHLYDSTTTQDSTTESIVSTTTTTGSSSRRKAKDIEQFLGQPGEAHNLSHMNSDERALELLKSLYSIASKFGRR